MNISDRFMWLRVFCELLCCQAVLFRLGVRLVEELKASDGESK